MRRFIFFTGALFTITFSRAQNVGYTVISDDPNSIKPAAVSIDPFYADTWGTNVTLGFGVRADAMLLGRFGVNVDFRRAYLDMNARDHMDESLPTPEKGLKKMRVFEVGGSFSLIDRTGSKSLKVVLSQTSSTVGNTKYTNTKYIMVPGNVRRILQVRAGLSNVRTAMDVQDGLGEGSSFRATSQEDTSSFTFGGFGYSVDGSATYGAYSMMNLIVLHGGISFRHITNLLLQTDDYGQKGNVGYYDFYVDAMMAPGIIFSDIQTVGGQTWDLSSSEIKRLGWRMGLTFRSSSRSFLTYKCELGSRPGFRGEKSMIGPNSFLLLSMGWSIPFRAKFLGS
ncbi:MAG: hypothetical protein K0R65_1310 [Crocinitomicaceae bacterium]|jgi:hypothetical protein|nr:hypothetical protein [Crocinitomicaceae bacterium]